MIEYILDMYYPSGAAHRVRLSKESFDELYAVMNPSTFNSSSDDIFTNIWALKDANGSFINLRTSKCSMVKLWARHVANPLNSEELYENPLS
jgi:hypothetical protein